MWTASALKRNCAHCNVLGKLRKRTPAQKKAMDKGTEFHALADAWLRGDTVANSRDKDVHAWFEALRTWKVPAGAIPESAVGLGANGAFVPVTEDPPGSHVYKADKPLLTAGRADVMWLEERDGMRILHLSDWKTGRSFVDRPERNLQVAALGFAAAAQMDATHMCLGIYYARQATWEWSPVIALDSEAAADLWRDVHAAATLDDTPRPGPWCGGCWEKNGCAAYQATQEAA